VCGQLAVCVCGQSAVCVWTGRVHIYVALHTRARVACAACLIYNIVWLVFRILNTYIAPSQDRGAAAPDDRHRQGGRQQHTPTSFSSFVIKLLIRTLILTLPTSLLVVVPLAFAFTAIIINGTTTAYYAYCLPFFSPPASHRLRPPCCLLPATLLAMFAATRSSLLSLVRLIPLPAIYYSSSVAFYLPPATCDLLSSCACHMCMASVCGGATHANGLLAKVLEKRGGGTRTTNATTTHTKPLEPTSIAIRPTPQSAASHIL